MPLLDSGAGRRPWREYLEPAVVIMVGVLAVVVFGVVLYERSTRDDTYRTAPLTTPSASPAAQIPIPLPSVTPSDAISIERVPDAGPVDLAAEGTVDWVQWGEQGRFATVRDANGGFAIREGTPGEPRRRHTGGPQRFTWTGGAPLAKASGVTSGVRTCGTGRGFTLSAPAGPGPHILTLYVGVSGARGSLQTELSTDSGTKAVDTWEIREPTMATTAYVISYQASRTGKISVKWITDASFDTTCGGVALQAATLS